MSRFIAALLVLPAGLAAADKPADVNVARLIKQLDVTQPVKTRRDAIAALKKAGKQSPQALAALQRSIRSDPDASVRRAAIDAVAVIIITVQKQKQICPIEIVAAWEDKDATVREMARTYVGLFGGKNAEGRWVANYPKGAAEILMRVARSADLRDRSQAAFQLGYVANQNDAVLKAIDRARQDKHWRVRHNAELAHFHATGKRDVYISHVVRLSVFLADRKPIAPADFKKLPPDQKSDVTLQQMTQLALLMNFGEETRQRPKQIADIIRKLLEDRSAKTRRQAVKFLKSNWATPEIELSTIGEADLRHRKRQPKQDVNIFGKPGTWLKSHGFDRQLKSMSQNDADESVRRAAEAAFSRIEDGMKRGAAKKSP